MDGIERAFNKRNAADEAKRARLAARRLAMQDVRTGSLDEISDDLGDQRAGRFIALSSGSEPTDADAVGAFMSAEGEVFDDLTVNIGTVKLGQPSAGFNTDGDFFAALGALIINADGQTITGMGFPLRFDATDGSENRRARLGMYAEDGETGPNFAMSYGDPAEYEITVPNGDFESGDLTNWTQASGSTQVVLVSSVVKPEDRSNPSEYCAKLNNFIPSTVLASDYITVTAGQTYRLFVKVYTSTPIIGIAWYTAANALISTTTKTAATGNWLENILDAVAPATAAKAKLYISGAGYVDDVRFECATIADELRFGDAGLNYNRGLWPEQWWGGWDAAQVFGSNGTRKTMVYLDVPTMWGGYVSYLSTDDAANGDYYTLKIPLAAGTYEWRMNYRSATDRGKVELYVNGTKVSGATPFDMYAGTAAVNQAWTVSSIVIPKHGVHEFKVVVNGQHASSSDYRVAASFITIRRTG